MSAERKKTKIVWREFYNESAVAQLAAIGTLPRNEIEIDTTRMDGEEVAAAIAKDCNSHEGECFREGGDLVILEPEEFAGTYDIHVDYEPYFYAHSRDT